MVTQDGAIDLASPFWRQSYVRGCQPYNGLPVTLCSSLCMSSMSRGLQVQHVLLLEYLSTFPTFPYMGNMFRARICKWSRPCRSCDRKRWKWGVLASFLGDGGRERVSFLRLGENSSEHFGWKGRFSEHGCADCERKVATSLELIRGLARML